MTIIVIFAATPAALPAMLTVPRALLAGSRLQQLALLRAASRSRARSSTAGGGDAQATAAERLGLAVFGTMVRELMPDAAPLHWC